MTTVFNTDKILTDATYGAHVLNGNGKVDYGATGVPCDVTFFSSCVIVELDVSRRFVYTKESRRELASRGIEAEPDEDFSLLSGFIATYKSSSEAKGKPSIWPDGGNTLVCKPAYMNVAQPKPTFVWKELCCSEEDGNEASRPTTSEPISLWRCTHGHGHGHRIFILAIHPGLLASCLCLLCCGR